MQFESPEKAVRFVRALGCVVSAYILGSTIAILVLAHMVAGC